MESQMHIKEPLRLFGNWLGAIILFLTCTGTAQDALFYNRLDEDAYLNQSNILNDSGLVFDVRYQNDWPEIDNALNVYYLGVHKLFLNNWGTSVQLVNDYQTSNQNETFLLLGGGKKLVLNRFEVDLSLALQIGWKQVITDAKTLQLGESDFGFIQNSIDFPIGSLVKYNYSADTTYDGYIKTGFFCRNVLEQDNASIVTGSSSKRRVFGYSVSVVQSYDFFGQGFSTSFYGTYLNNSARYLAQIGWKQIYYYSKTNDELGFNVSYFSNQTIGLGLLFSVNKIQFNLSRGIETFSNPEYLSNPYYFLGLKLKI